jgi:hypothetical protein
MPSTFLRKKGGEKLNTENFSLEEKNLIISSILKFSSGQHPYPSEENLKYFDSEYIKKLLKKSFKKISPEYRNFLLGIINKIKN